MKRLTLDDFIKIPHRDIISLGVLNNSYNGLFMSDDGEELLWVAVKGTGNDWAIYCHYSYHDVDYVMRHGDKVTREEHIKRCVLCTDEVFKLYRY